MLRKNIKVKFFHKLLDMKKYFVSKLYFRMLDSLLNFILSDRVHLVRYEDISLNPEKASDELMDFLDLRKSSNVRNFILSHTNGRNSSVEIQRSGPVNTVRNSTEETFQWKDKMPVKDIFDIQTMCAESMNVLGYNPMTNINVNRLDENYELLKSLSPDF